MSETTYCMIPLLVILGIPLTCAAGYFSFQFLKKHCPRNAAMPLTVVALMGIWATYISNTSFVPCDGDGAVAETVNEAMKGFADDRTNGTTLVKAETNNCECFGK